MKRLQVCTLIRLARDEKKLTRDVVAEYVGVSSTTLARWERGENKPFFHEVAKLSEILERPLDYFAGNEDAPESHEPQPANLPAIFQTLAKHSRMIELMADLDDEILETFEAEMEALVEARKPQSKSKQA